MARLVSKKLDRKHSAIGSIIVSHSDLEGVARYSFLGVTNFSIDAESNYDDQAKNESLTADIYLNALVPWTDTVCYTIPKGAVFSTRTGINFIAAESKTIQTWSSNWSDVLVTQGSLRTFKSTDGWNNYKYLTIPIVQGDIKEVTLGTSDGTAAQSFIVASLDIEAADSYYTKQFCYVEVITTDGQSTIWTEVQHLQTAENTDTVFEVNILDDMTGTEIKFGDSVCGAIPSNDATLIFHFLETKGAEGNVTDLYSFQNEINGVTLPTNTKYLELSVGCQNTWPIIGGKDLETLAEFKSNAETAYAKNYKILHTFSELQDNINLISPIPLLKVKTKTYYETATVNSTTVYKNSIGITGLSTGLIPLNSTEKNIFEKVINTNLNSIVLSNKNIKYLTPSIVEIDSALEIELKTPVVSLDDFETDMEDYLSGILGKYNLETLDSYMQAELLKNALQHSNNIGSIQSSNLFTIDATNVSYGNTVDTETYFFLFTFTFPSINMDVTSREGYCDKALADGNEIVAVFNVNINSNPTTFVAEETSNSTEDVFLYNIDSYFDTDALTIVNLYNNNINNSKYSLKQLLKEKHCFTKQELANANVLQFAETNNYSNPSFYELRSATNPTYYLLLDANTIANYLGFNNTVDESNIQTVYTALLSSMENQGSKISVSFEPVDKTVTSDWNTIMYYNNIEVLASD